MISIYKLWYRFLFNQNQAPIGDAFGKLKVFKIRCEKYRNRGKRLGLRFNLIAGIYNFQLAK